MAPDQSGKAAIQSEVLSPGTDSPLTIVAKSIDNLGHLARP